MASELTWPPWLPVRESMGPMMCCPVSWMSSSDGSVRFSSTARFIFAGSRIQLERPTMATGGSTSMPWRHLSGMSGECSARPTSSSRSTVMVSCAASCDRFAISNCARMEEEEDMGEHWYWKRCTDGNFRQNSRVDCWPWRLLWMTCIASVFELPGLPTTNTGMRLSRQTITTKRFSVRASLSAMPSPTSMLSQKNDCALVTTTSNPSALNSSVQPLEAEVREPPRRPLSRSTVQYSTRALVSDRRYQ
mmetsp:Transcript_16367/g.38489  ORF Transcript_16367/g.38489 Transcript_16367/m.38489 type:complete len:248 (+) Transcript_16367:195-938(+)